MTKPKKNLTSKVVRWRQCFPACLRASEVATAASGLSTRQRGGDSCLRLVYAPFNDNPAHVIAWRSHTQPNLPTQQSFTTIRQA